jgi:hypothetical protein
MPHRMTVNQKVQLGKETTPGTAVPANKLIEAFQWSIGGKADVKTFRAMGRRHNAVVEENREWSEGKLTGELDYAAIIYPLSMVYGAVTGVAHSPSVTAFDYIWTPPLTGATSVQTWTLENGDSVQAEKYPYLMASGFGYKISRKDTSISADLFAQQMVTGITPTASPTVVALIPIVGKHANIYLDMTSGAIGGAQLLNVLDVSFAASGYYTQFWPINRTNVSFTSQIDLPPKQEVKLCMEADSVGMSELAHLQAGDKMYMRVDCQGPTIDVTNSIKATFRHDMCLVMTDMTPQEDKDGVYAIEWTFELAEDTAWASGQAHVITATNLLTAI